MFYEKTIPNKHMNKNAHIITISPKKVFTSLQQSCKLLQLIATAKHRAKKTINFIVIKLQKNEIVIKSCILQKDYILTNCLALHFIYKQLVLYFILYVVCVN